MIMNEQTELPVGRSDRKRQQIESLVAYALDLLFFSSPGPWALDYASWACQLICYALDL